MVKMHQHIWLICCFLLAFSFLLLKISKWKIILLFLSPVIKLPQIPKSVIPELLSILV